VIAVGAVNAMSPGTAEPFSSNGPVTHVYPVRTVIPKPDVCAPDRVAVSGAGGFKTVFVGTSAAAPHVAGLCALAWSARPDLTASALRAALVSSAVDLGVAGRDNIYGWGRADGIAMYALVAVPTPTPTPTPTAPALPPAMAVTTAPQTASPTPVAIVTTSPFAKRYVIGGLAGRTAGPGATVAPGSGASVTGAPTAVPSVDPYVPPTRPFVRWYPAARWAAGR